MKSRLLLVLLACSVGCWSPSSPSKPSAPPPAGPGQSTFLGTVTSIDAGNASHPLNKWRIILRIDKLVSGAPLGDDFWFAVHSPSQENIKVGQRYSVQVKKVGEGYEVLSYSHRD